MAATQPPVSKPVPFPTPRSLWENLNRDWLTGHGNFDDRVNQQWFANVETRYCQLQQHERLISQSATDDEKGSKAETHPLLLIAEPEPHDFLASFWAALLSGWNVALANPHWGDRERNMALEILQPSLIWPASNNLSSLTFPHGHADMRPCSLEARHSLSCPSAILIPTGGTGGKLKFARHTWTTILTAANGFCQTFPTPIHTYCVLPVHHVSGLMQLLRAWISQAQVVITAFKTLETQPPLISNPTSWYISLVPTQLTRLLTAGKGPWLSKFHAVLLGGAPTWPDLLAQATEQKIPICLSYGMTETAAMVAAQTPREARHNPQATGSGSRLPHAQITIEAAGKTQPSNTVGQIVIHSQAIAHGYYSPGNPTKNPDFSSQTFRTDDLGYLTSQGQLHITGRASSKIISGGENIFPAEVEAALHSTGQVKDVCVFSQPDPHWGEVVVAAFVPAHPDVSETTLRTALSNGKAGSILSRYKHPKKWISIKAVPRNAQGKILKSVLASQIELSQVSPPQIEQDQLSNASNTWAKDSDGGYLPR